MHLLSSLVEYTNKGYSIIPVHKNTKKPAIKWQKYQKERAPLEILGAWAEKTSTFGIVTGTISGITVVDIDVKHDEKTPLETFPETYTVQTPSGGYHLYYQHSTHVQTGSDQYHKLFPYVDIRNEGGYVVAPPSEGYTVINDIPLAPFPVKLFPKKKRTALRNTVNVSTGNRNNTIASAIGTLLLSSPETKWPDLWVVVQSINKTYNPPLPAHELKTTFESIASLERRNREHGTPLVESSMHVTEIEAVRLQLRKNRSNIPYKDLANAILVLERHPKYASALRYDTFLKTIVLNGEPLTEEDTLGIQRFLQTEAELSNLSFQSTEHAIAYRAHQLKFNSALEYLQSLKWDGTPRVDTWLINACGVPDDEYHRAVGSNWLRALAGRIARPGSKYDHVLVIEGGQGAFKTFLFAELGKTWHTETTVQAENKDFLMQFSGKAIVEFSEGGTLTRSETRTLKSIITRTHDKYRAPYARSDEEHPRQCVFCMTTNDSEYLKDETGNRRWLPVRIPDGLEANIEWIRQNREQLFAEAYARIDEPTWIHPKEATEAAQEARMITDELDRDVVQWYSSLTEKQRKDEVRVINAFDAIKQSLGDDRKAIIDRSTEWRIASIFKTVLKLKPERKRINGFLARVWVATEKTPKFEPQGGDF